VKLGRRDDALADAWAQFRRHPSRYSYADLMRYTARKVDYASRRACTVRTCSWSPRPGP
jgi:hypothetical protein